MGLGNPGLLSFPDPRSLLCPAATLDTEQELYRYQQRGLSITDTPPPPPTPLKGLPCNTGSFFPHDGEGIHSYLQDCPSLSARTPQISLNCL